MNIIGQISTTLLALLVGGMALIALGLLPYWRSLEPTEFTMAFAASLPFVAETMILLTIIGTGSIIISAGMATWKKLPSRHWFIAGALGALIMLATVPLYFGTANPLLASGTLGADDLMAELTTWQNMHLFRTTIGIAGLFCAIRAGYQQ